MNFPRKDFLPTRPRAILILVSMAWRNVNTISYQVNFHGNQSDWKNFPISCWALAEARRKNMDTSWLSETSSEMLNYFYEQITGDEEIPKLSNSLSALSKGVWITDLPMNDYEPLENSPVAKQVGVSFFSLVQASGSQFLETVT